MKRIAGIVLAATFGLAFAATPLTPLLCAEPLTALEARGKQIFFEGRDPGGGEILATVGRSGMSVLAIMLPCANCHGDDGLGRPEGGMRPPNITWTELTKPYGHRHPDGRNHPPFDEAAVGYAVAGGVDPAGNELDPAMPRYDMADASIRALVAYLQRLSADLDPGLSATAIRIATVAPDTGKLAPASGAAVEMIRAYFDDVNSTGGVFGRNIELAVLDPAPGAGPTLANARRLAEGQEVFARLEVFGAGAGRETLPDSDEIGVPRISAFSLATAAESPRGGNSFFLLSGLTEQARALVRYAASRLELSAPRVAVILPDGNGYSSLAEAVEGEAQTFGWPPPVVTRISYGDALARQVSRLEHLGVGIIYYFGPPQQLPAFTEAAAKADWQPYLFLSGVQTGRAAFDVSPLFGDKLFLAYPSVPSDLSSPTSIEFEALRHRHGLPPQHRAAQAMAYATARVLVEGLRRSGKAVTRTRLVAALEELKDFETGVTPPISFGPNRRIGALGAYVLNVDPSNNRFGPDIVWIAL